MSEFFTMRSTAYTLATSLLVTCLAFGSSLAASADKGKVPDTIAQRVAACVVCHGKEGRAGSDGYYPRIAGKPAGYLYNQLINFRDGKRTYPVMTSMLENMSDAYLREIAQYFSEQHPPYPAPQATQSNPAELERGRMLVHEGDKARGIPACIACHSAKMTGMAPAIPGLVGLPRLSAGTDRCVENRHAPGCHARLYGRDSQENEWCRYQRRYRLVIRAARAGRCNAGAGKQNQTPSGMRQSRTVNSKEANP